MKTIYIYGASGHGLVVADIALACGYEKVIFIDDGENEFLTFDNIKENSFISIALGIGNNSVRAKLFDKVTSFGFDIATLIHPSSVISQSASISKGTVIMANSVVNAEAKIAKGVIINTGAIVEHECRIDDFVHISPNVALAGNVKVGKLTHIGIGSNIIQGIIIGENVIVGGGSTVIRDIENKVKVVGVPATSIALKMGGGKQ